MLRLKTILQSSHILLIISLLIIIFSFIRCNINYSSKYNIEDKVIEGILIEKTIDGNKLSFIIKGKEKVKCTYYMTKESEVEYYSKLDLGVTLTLNGTLSIPSNNTVPNTFNYKKYLYYKHINYIMNVDNITIKDKNVNIFYKIKNMIINRIKEYKSYAYLNTFILGYKNDLDKDVYSKYQESGISHIFAISGMHISLLSMLILKLLSKIKDNIRYPIVIIFLLLYVFLTNYSSSVIRTSILFIIIYLNKRFDFNLDTIKCFYITISLILLIDPFRLYDIGFIYSSISSYSLIRYNYLIKGNYIVTILKVSILAFLVTLPITVNMNYQINILAILNNIVVVPIISLIVYPLSLITFIIKPLDILFFNVMNIFEYISKYFLVFNIVIPKLNIIFIIIYYVILHIFFISYNKKILLINILLLTIIKYSYVIDNNTYIYYLDVGQGDSTLIKYKDEAILIDTGGKVSFEKESWKIQTKYYYTDTNIKFFKSIGIDNIDLLILTHGDYDHMGEASHLIDNFKVKNLKLNKGTYNDLEKEILKYNINQIDTYKGKLKIYFLDDGNIYDDENDNSTITLLVSNNKKFLFMGDASKKNELNIIKKYNLSNIEVLKLGHHGSNTSSDKEFINITNPKFSIISVGKNNRYGHPNKETLDNVINSKVYRTDEVGTITFQINNEIINANTCV